jgi:exoribonuclease R
MADLLVHTIFKVFIVEKNCDTNTLKFWGKYLDEVCEKISMCEVDSEKLEYASDDYFNAQVMEDKLGTINEAIVDDMFPGSFFVRTDNYIEGRVDFFLTEEDSKEILKLNSPEEVYAYVEEHKKVFGGFYDYNEKLYGFSRNGRMYLRFGDKVMVCCTGAYPDRREIDFTLVRKL